MCKPTNVPLVDLDQGLEMGLKSCREYNDMESTSHKSSLSNKF